MAELREPDRITLPEAVNLLTAYLPADQARKRLDTAFVTKAVLGQPNFALSYESARIDWTTGEVAIPRKRGAFRPTFSRQEIETYFFGAVKAEQMEGAPVDPDISWYLNISKERGVTPRCPFASIDRCPRCYESRSLLGSAGSTKIPPDEDERLKARWEKTDLWPKTAEESSYMTGNGERFNAFGNFCPEVAYERFKFFAANFSYHYDDIDRDFAHERLSRRHGKVAHWEWGWTHVTPMHFTECPLYSPLIHGQANMIIEKADNEPKRQESKVLGQGIGFAWELTKLEIKKRLGLQ